MDALTHAVEAYIGNSTTIDTRRDALKAVKLIFENIDIAYEHGDNIQARRNMLHASFYAGCAFTKSYVGYVHAVAHSLGGQYNVPPVSYTHLISHSMYSSQNTYELYQSDFFCARYYKQS